MSAISDDLIGRDHGFSKPSVQLVFRGVDVPQCKVSPNIRLASKAPFA